MDFNRTIIKIINTLGRKWDFFLVRIVIPGTDWKVFDALSEIYPCFRNMKIQVFTAPRTKLWGGFQSYVPVSLSLHRGSNVTITHDALDLTIQGPPRPWPQPPLLYRDPHW